MSTGESTVTLHGERPARGLAGHALRLVLGITIVAVLASVVFRLQHLADPARPSRPTASSPSDDIAPAVGALDDAALGGQPPLASAADGSTTQSPPPLTRRGHAIRLIGRINSLAFDAALMAGVILTVFVAYGLVNNRWYHVLVVEGGSMYPTITAGDLVVITRPPAQIEPGMILTLEVDHSVVTHRVERVNPDGTFVTKGDANSVGDDFSANSVHVVGQYLFRIPLVGNLLPAGAPGPVPGSGAWFTANAVATSSGTSGTWAAVPGP